MHSSSLRSHDFHLKWQGCDICHETFFGDFTRTHRLGIFAPNGCEGAGTIALVMAYITAFYNCYRSESETFFAYPDFFTFQHKDPAANYSMFDIWPKHKNVQVSNNANETAAAMTDRGINILLVPDRPPQETAFEKVQIEANRRNIKRCFLYSETGQIQHSNLEMTCKAQPLSDWALAMLNSVPKNEEIQQQVAQWTAQSKREMLHQSFCEIPLEEALHRL